MQKAKINNLVGVGQATNSQKECNGYFKAEFNVENAKELALCSDSRNVIYSGTVIDQGIERDLSFPIIMSKTKRGCGGIHIEFTATGNPYDTLQLKE